MTSATQPAIRADRFQIKLYAAEGQAAAPHALIPVFHAWIRDHALDELLIDVADYTHVHHGPGVLLEGHAADYYYDLGEGRPGLLYSRKRDFDGDLAAGLRDGVQRARAAAALLEGEGGPDGLAFATNEVLVRVIDRLHLANDEAGFAAIAPVVTEALTEAFGAAPAAVTQAGTPRGPLTLRANW